MKRIICVVFFSAHLIVPWGYAETITLRADIWCPYNCDPESDAPGFMVEIARKIFGKAGHFVDYQVLNWARAVQETRLGKYDGIIGAYKKEVPDFIFPENEQGRAVDMFYAVKDSSWHYEKIDSLSVAVIGIIEGYSYGDDLDNYISKHKEQFVILHGEDAFPRNLSMLLLGRTTAFIENQSVVNNYLKNHNIHGQIIEAGLASTENIYIAFSPRKPASKVYAKILSNGIDKLRSSGDLQKIMDKYGLHDWK